MVEYLIKEDSRGIFTVSKWEGGKEPSAVYEVQERRNGYVCDCPARGPLCIHMAR